MQKAKIGILSDSRMLNHKSKYKHPQCPARLKSILKMLAQKQYLTHQRVNYLQEYDRYATDQDIRLVYSQKYLNYLQQLWPKNCKKTCITDSDSYYNSETQRVARLSTGGVLEGIDQIMKGNWSSGFSIIRPPGHHSGWKQKANGFCFLNNVAIGARYLQKKYEMKKIAILDYDIHQGDGTHHIFNEDPNVLFISVHRHDRGAFYPFGDGGNYPNCGIKEGEGSKINIPLNTVNKKRKSYSFQTHGDNQYIYIYNRIIHPIISEFDPEFILVSSGFDAARKDYLGGFNVTPNTYFFITKRLLQLQKSLLCVLEGGYHLLSIAQSATAVVQGLLEQNNLPQPLQNLSYQNIHLKCHLEKEYHDDLDLIIQHHSKYWKSLQSENAAKYTQLIKNNKEKVFGVVSDQSSSSSSSEQEDSNKEDEETKAQEPTQQSTKSEQSQNKGYKNFRFTKSRVHKYINPKELSFYQSQYPENIFAPKFYNVQNDCMLVENFLFKQREAIVVEIQLGRKSKNKNLSEQSRQRQLKRQQGSTAHNYGFSITAITTANSKEDKIMVKQQATIKKIIYKSVCKQNKFYFTQYIKRMIECLKKSTRKYFGTHLMMIKGRQKSAIYWIDFYQWCKILDYLDQDQRYDQDLVEGLENLLKMIQEFE